MRSRGFYSGYAATFSGVRWGDFSVTGLKEVLAGDGGPCTVEERTSRFAKYLADVLHGRNHEKVRMIIE